MTGGAWNAVGMTRAAEAARGGEYERGFPPLIGGGVGGPPPGKILKLIVLKKHFKPLLVKISDFKVDFESQFDIQNKANIIL